MIEERKARVLAQAGYDDSLDGEIYATVAHQNCNMSVSASDEFLERVEKGDIWTTINRTNYEGREYNAPELMHKIAQAAWDCGDPGMHFKTRMNEWHTCPNSGPIRSSNPCSEYIFLDNTACNLSSINLLKFLRDDNSFDVEGFCHTVDVMITAMEILVSRSEYPTEAITTNSEDFRTLGLGYANLGALLMAKGLPYDSDEGRDYAASITALMTGQAYKRSAELAAIKGPFNGFAANREPMLAVIDKHLRSAPTQANFEHRIWWDSIQIWDQALTLGYEHGYRNAQVTLLAPTGTISFMMDCTTTGVEPDVALVNYKKLVGGGTIKHVNDIVPRALKSLGYSEGMIREYSLWLESHGSFDDLPTEFAMNWDEKKVFDCAFPSKPGGRSIAWEGHVKMVAALQPFLSGSISKTINMPQESTVEDIERAYMMAWKLGCKSIAVYRDGCKQTQVLTTQNTEIPGTVNTQKVNKLLGDVDKLIPDGKELAAMIATSMIDEALSGKDTVGTCQTCGKSHTIVVYPYGSSPALVCTACMDSIQQQIARENTGEETNNSYWMEKIESLQSEIRALNHIIEKNGRPQRKRLPDERQAITHKFAVANCEGYLTVGLFEDGSPGEIFLRMAKEGSTLSGFADGFACMVSMALQYGIPLDVMVNKFMHSRFEPSGWTPNTDIQYATSILDYIFRYLQQKFPGNGKIIEFTGHLPPVAPEDVAGTIHVTEQPLYHEQTHSTLVMYTSHNVCPECGSFLMVNGSCHVCKTCGFQDGCTG
jgi:ribonucleoside-diphosphate reductase alpha chain